MPVAQHRRLAGRMQPIRINQRMTAGLDDLDVFQFRFVQAFGDELRGTLNIGDVFGERADAGDAEKILQLGEQANFVRFDKRISGEGHNPL